MAKITITLLFLFSFYSHGVGLIETTATLAVGAEVARRGVQKSAQLTNQARQQVQNFEAKEKERQRQLDQALSR